MAHAIRTAAAQLDLEDIAYQIAIEDRRPLTAEKVVRSLIEKCDSLAELAESATLGTPAPRIGQGVRLISHQRWVILFRYDPQGVIVLRFADGSQDYLSWKLNE